MMHSTDSKSILENSDNLNRQAFALGLIAGKETPTESLYSTFWIFCLDILKHLENGNNKIDNFTKNFLYNNELHNKFLEDISETNNFKEENASAASEDKIDNHKSTTKNDACFDTLIQPAQNLLMAAAELNLQLSLSEENINDCIGAEYKLAATKSFDCINELISKFLRDFLQRHNSRLHSLYEKCIQITLGEKINFFKKKSKDLYGKTKDLCASELSAFTENDKRDRGEKIDPHAPITKLVEVLQYLKRCLAAKLSNSATEDSEPSKIDEPTKIAILDEIIRLRAQKHQLAVEKNSLLQSAKSKKAQDLASSLSEFNLKAGEIDAKIGLLGRKGGKLALNFASTLQEFCGEHTKLLKKLEKRNHNLERAENLAAVKKSFKTDDYALVFSDICESIDYLHILLAQAKHMRESLKNQINEESKNDLTSLFLVAKNCIKSNQTQLELQKAKFLKKHEAESEKIKSMERSLLMELKAIKISSNSNDALKMDLCATKIAEAYKISSQTLEKIQLNDHKTFLREIYTKLMKLLETI